MLALAAATSAAAAASGASAPPAAPLCAAHQIDVGGRARSYSLCLPENATAPAPLLLAFHGRAESAEGMKVASHLDAEAGAAGIITAYLDGCDAGGCAGDGGGWQEEVLASPIRSAADGDDVEFIGAVISAVSAGHDIDRNRVFAAATADGGTFASVLACEASELFAAVAVIDAAAAPAPSEPAADVSPCVRFTGCAFDRDVPWCAVPEANQMLAPLVSLESSILHRERLIETFLASVEDDGASPLPAMTAPPPVQPVLEVTVLRQQPARPVRTLPRLRARR